MENYNLEVTHKENENRYLRKADRMLKRIVTYCISGILAVFAVLVLAGVGVKKWSAGKIGPGVTVWGRDL